jgi:hypothetical protein
MWSTQRGLRTSEIELGAPLSGLERDWLIQCLRARRGVADASYRCEGLGQVVIAYDPGVITPVELVTFVGAVNLAESGPPV